MYKHKLALALMVLSVLLTWFGVGSVHAVRSSDAPPASSLQGNTDIELDEKLAQFEGYLEDFRREHAIPGMSVAIVKDQKLLWAQGFGYADVEAGRPAAADTPYEIASLTKTLSSTILLQLVEQGKVSLDDPVSKYGIYIDSPGVIRVKHLLGHTSERVPGSIFLYNGGRYAYLQKVIERASGKPLAEWMANTLLNPLGMSDSAPFYLLNQPAYQHIRAKLSKPYGYDQSYFSSFSTSGGFVSTVLDLAKFDIALDQEQLIDPETRQLAFTAQTLSSGDTPVYGLGWYAQEFQGTKIAWHQGWDCFSHLYIKFLDQNYTLIVFTNTGTLGEYTDLSVMRYPVALAFYKLFIKDMALDDLVDWDAEEQVITAQLQAAKAAGNADIARQELHNRVLTAKVLERSAEARSALKTYIQYFTSPELTDFDSRSPFAVIDRVGNNTYPIVEFTLAQDTDIDIFAIGNTWQGRMVDYGGIEDVSSRKLIWVMTPDRSSPAGGVWWNRQANEKMTLQAGTYRLHYRTDTAHAFGNWVDLPPDTLFWGIALYSVGEDAGITTRSITPSPQDKLLAEQAPPAAPPISKFEYAVFWTCLAVLLSALVVIPVVLWRVKSAAGTTQSARRWTKIAAWVAWTNSLLCPLIAFVLTMIVDLETVVEEPIIITSTSGFQGRLFAGAAYVCIALTIAQMIFTILAWKGKQRSLLERLYYSLVTIAATGYLVLLGSLSIIPAWF